MGYEGSPRTGGTGPGPGASGLWHEPQVWVLGILAIGIHFSCLTGPPLQGEETRRATVAMEMLQTGDWIVPSLQGEVLFMSNRPPLQQWLIAASGSLRGGVDALAVRLPSALAVLLTVVLIYAYCRAFMSRSGAFVAAAAFASMGQVVELGHLGETDALFTLFVGASMLLWHLGYARGWPAVRTWGIAYACAALATLTKGPQAPVYFAASVGLHLLLRRDWRFAISGAHAFGVLVFLGIWGSWQLAFLLRTDIASVRHLYLGDVSLYGRGRGLAALVKHLALYPAEIIACTLPWSLLLIGYLRRGFRRASDNARPAVAFAAGAVLVCLPSVWWVVGAQSRFFMPLYPCVAILAGVIAQRALDARDDIDPKMAHTWRDFAVGLSIAMTGAAAVFGAASLGLGSGSPLARLAQPAPFGLALVVATVALAAIAAAIGLGRAPGRQWVVAACLAAFGGLYNGAIANIDVRESVDKDGQMARLRAALPSHATLYSVGDVDHAFAYYYRDPIVRCAWPDPDGLPPADVEYFCFAIGAEPLDPFPWGWEPIGHLESKSPPGATFPTMTVVARRAPWLPACVDPHDVVRRYLERQARGGPAATLRASAGACEHVQHAR